MTIGTLDQIVKEYESGVTDFTENGKCSNCGQCCSDILPVSESEIRTIRKYIKRHNIREAKFVVGPLANQAINLVCPFRNEKDRKCNIYEVRPLNYYNKVRAGRHFHPETEEVIVKLLEIIRDKGLEEFHRVCRSRYPLLTDYDGLYIP